VTSDQVLLTVIIITLLTLIFQGYAILTESYGYKNEVRYKKRAENLRKQMEKIIHANGRFTKED
jgi:hypothetical protein